MDDSVRHKQKCVVVTGGCGFIGQAVLRHLSKNGYAIAFGYHQNPDLADDLQLELGQDSTVISEQTDVSKPEEVDRLFDRAAHIGTIHGLVNLAAAGGKRQQLVDLNAAETAQIFSVNVIGALNCAQAFARHASRSNGGEGGAIVNFSSQAARSGGYRLIPYAASKGAVESMTVALASELGSEGIRVNAVSPGIIRRPPETPDEQQSAASIPLGRFGTPDEVSELVTWLLSDGARYVTGAILPVNGGRRA